MGQQQLLLVILVTIIVGIATVVAINTFGSAADSANLDAVRQDLATMASSAQGYYMKPSTLGGGSNKFDGLTWGNMGALPCNIAADGSECTNENAVYTIDTPTGASFEISADPTSEENPTLTATVFANDIDIADS